MASNPVIVQPTGVGDFQVRVDAQGPSFLVDEPLSEGGLASGPTPYDLLSAALGACTAMTLRLYARRKDFPLTDVQVAVTHRRDPMTGRDVFDRALYLEGELDDAQKARLLAMSDRCPVGKTLQGGADITTHFAPKTEPVIPNRPCDCTHPTAMATACDEMDIDCGG
ncbi:MAG: OsmC family protein [Luteibacter sp.]